MTKKIALLLSMVLLISACGKKGPLSLPDEDTKAESHSPTSFFTLD